MVRTRFSGAISTPAPYRSSPSVLALRALASAFAFTATVALAASTRCWHAAPDFDDGVGAACGAAPMAFVARNAAQATRKRRIVRSMEASWQPRWNRHASL